MIPANTKTTISCSFCTANDWFDFGSRLLTCVKETQKPILSTILYKFTSPDPALPKKLAQFWTLSNCFLWERSRDGLRLAAALCYISHHLYNTNIPKSDLEVLTGIIYSENWKLKPLVIPYRKYNEANLLIAHGVVDVSLYSEHFSTWNFLFQNKPIETVYSQLRGMRDNKIKQRLLVDSLKLELSTKRIRKMVIEWGLDVRGLNIFAVIKKVGEGKWNMQTLLLMAPLVAELEAFGSRCDIFHPCSPLIIRACRVGIITNLLWRYQTSRNICLPKLAIVNILQFVSSPKIMHIGKSWSASKMRMRDGDNMMKNVIRMLGDTSETIYEAGIDCTPYPNGDISQVKKLDKRDEYGSMLEFIPAEEKLESTETKYTSLHDNVRRQIKCSQRSTSTSESTKITPYFMKPRILNNLPGRFGHRRRPKLDCTPYPNGNISQLKKLEKRDEYGPMSEYMPVEEKKESTKTNYTSLHENVRRQRKRSTSISELYVSKKITPSSMKPRNLHNPSDRFGHRQHPELNSLEHNHDAEYVCYKDPISSNHKDKDLSERPRINHHAQPNTVQSVQMSRRSFGIQDRNVGCNYNSSVSPRRSDLLQDIELKMRWTLERSKFSSNGLTPLGIHSQKSACLSSLKPVLQSLQIWTPEKERVCLRKRLEDLSLNPTSKIPNRAKDTQLSNSCKEKLLSVISRKKFLDAISRLQKGPLTRGLVY